VIGDVWGSVTLMVGWWKRGEKKRKGTERVFARSLKKEEKGSGQKTRLLMGK